MKALIVTGDRYAKWETWMPIIDKELSKFPVLVIQGGANGIDYIALSACDDTGRTAITVPAQWDQHGKSAGPKRNVAMLSILRTLQEQGYVVAVYAFHDDLEGSKGTKHMVNIAISAGVETWLFTSDGRSNRLDLRGQP